jgi:hypothetical protein
MGGSPGLCLISPMETFRPGSYTSVAQSTPETRLPMPLRRAEARRMKLTDWLAVVPTIQNGWTLTALIAILLYLYFSRRGAR